MSAPRFTPEQRAAVADRSGSSLLAANAGSGKTAVMVERFVEAVRIDGVAVGSILALTFTEKAAGELRERVRRRLLELGENEHARAVDGAWIGTIHGFCARVLRSRPLPAGLDPRFEVLDEAAAGRLAVSAYERALDGWVDRARRAGRGPRRRLRRPVSATSCSAPTTCFAAAAPRTRACPFPTRSRPRIPRRSPPRARPPPASSPRAGDGIRVGEARAALDACERLLAAGADGVPRPATLDAAKLGAGAKALTTPACEEYREAWTAFRTACADHHARAALVLLDDLLGALRRGVRGGQGRPRGRRLRGPRAGRPRPARQRGRAAPLERALRADHGRRVPGHEPAPARPAGALERGNLFAVGDEFQSIYRFRHADVEIFRERRAALPAERVRGLAANFRSAGELLDVLNAAFAPVLGDGFRPLVAGREDPAAPSSAAADDAVLRLFDPDPPAGEPPVELLVTDTKGWEEHAGALGLGGLADQPWRRAEARLVAQRLREEVDAGRRPGDIVVLVRATASLRLFEQALEEQGLPTYVVGGRGYWSQEQVRDALAYLAALANPRDEHRALRRPRVPVLRRRRRRAGPARRRRPRDRQGPLGRAARRRPGGRRGPRSRRPGRRGVALAAPARRSASGCSRSRASSPASASGRSGSRSRRCSSGRSRSRATTSRSSRAPAASGGSRTCASSCASRATTSTRRGATCAASSTSRRPRTSRRPARARRRSSPTVSTPCG